MDSNFGDFSRYIATLGSDIPFGILLHKGSNAQLVQGLAQYGMERWTGVPHFYLLNKNNRIVKHGYYDIEYLKEYIGVRSVTTASLIPYSPSASSGLWEFSMM